MHANRKKTRAGPASLKISVVLERVPKGFRISPEGWPFSGSLQSFNFFFILPGSGAPDSRATEQERDVASRICAGSLRSQKVIGCVFPCGRSQARISIRQ